MILSIFEGLSTIGVFGRILFITIISVFMPLTAISFFRYMMPKKEKEYKKALDDMKIKSNRKVSDSHSPLRYVLPVSFASLICFFAMVYINFADQAAAGVSDSLLLTGAYFGEGNSSLVRQSMVVLGYAFLGGFLWSASNIIRRLVANDLSPSVYYSAGIRILLASATALVFSFILGAKGADAGVVNLKSSLAALAFLTGMFPERILQYLIKLFQQFINPEEINANQLSLYRIQGISMQHKERLEEVGIDNAQNLATTSLTQLLIDTPYQSRQLLDWIGQAKLLCYVKDDIDKLRSVGIRSVFDLFSKEKSSGYLQKVSSDLGLKPTLLENIYDQVTSDRGINSLYSFLNGVNTPVTDSSAPKSSAKTQKETSTPEKQPATSTADEK